MDKLKERLKFEDDLVQLLKSNRADFYSNTASKVIRFFESHGYRKVKPAMIPENHMDIHVWRDYTPDMAYQQAIDGFQSLNPDGLLTEDKE